MILHIECLTRLDIIKCKKSLKIPKGLSESVYWRRTDNTMAKRKGAKDKHNIYGQSKKSLKIPKGNQNP
jgi:hypothetical protein